MILNHSKLFTIFLLFAVSLYSQAYEKFEMSAVVRYADTIEFEYIIC